MLKPLLYAISIREVEEDEPVESECHDQQGNLARIHRQTYTRGRVAGDVDQHFGNQRPGIEHRDPPDLPVAEQPHEPNHRRHAKIEEQIGRYKIVQCLRIQVRFPIDDRIFRHRVLLCYFLDLLLSGFLLALASRQFQKVADIVREPDRWRRLWETEENEKDDGANAGPAKVVPGKKPNAKRSVVLRGCRGAQLWYAQLLQPLIELRLNVRRLNRFFLVYVGGGFPLVNRFGHIYLRLAGHHDCNFAHRSASEQLRNRSGDQPHPARCLRSRDNTCVTTGSRLLPDSLLDGASGSAHRFERERGECSTNLNARSRQRNRSSHQLSGIWALAGAATWSSRR